MSKVYKVVVVGLGKRGKHHAAAFKGSPRFELAGISTRDAARLETAAAELGHPRTATDPLALARQVRPDVFCFCTPPTVRLDLVSSASNRGRGSSPTRSPWPSRRTKPSRFARPSRRRG